jgi:hypothetical protein
MTLFEGMSASPRVLNASGVRTVVACQAPPGNGTIGGKGLVGSTMFATIVQQACDHGIAESGNR